jgi:hypothetical protein
MIRGPEDFHHFTNAVRIANLLVLAIALLLAQRSAGHRRPMLAAAGLVVLQGLVFELAPGLAPWEALLTAISRVPAVAIFSAGLAVGALLAWLGWEAVPPRPARALPG